MNKENRENYYETSDFSDLIRSHKGRKIGTTLKRITLNISHQIYDEANELDSYMHMGYQNVLKTAMTIGLTELYGQVSKHTVRNSKAARLPSRQSRSKWTVLKKQGKTVHNTSSPQ